MGAYKLVSFNLCPFVQRSVITLEEKGVPYDIEYIDLANKPDWLLKISPFGKVPLLQVDDKTLFESAVINEYLDEVTPGPRLHPADALQRAYNRSWIEFGSAMLIDGYRLMVAKDADAAKAAALAIKEKLGRVEKEIVGPFFNGDTFSLVDAAWAPALQRNVWCEDIEPSLQLVSETPKVAAWTQALLSRDCVKKSTIANIHEIFVEYLKGRGSPSRAEEASWLGQRAAPSPR